MTTVEDKKGVYQCRSCKQTFHQKDVKRVDNEQLGIHRNDTQCPYCGSSNFGLVDYPVDERELTYKNNRFYGLSHKQEDYINTYYNDEYIREVIDELYI